MLLVLAGCQAPNRSSTGTPSGWTPAQTTSTSVTLSTPGQVYHDVRLTNGADIDVRAPNVTIRNVELDGGYINNDISSCANGLLLDHVSILAGPGDQDRGQEAAVSYGGYTADHVLIDDRSEGFRVSSYGDCGPVTIKNTFVHITPPSPCGDWHGDGIQSWEGDAVTVRNVTIDMRVTNGCHGTAPFFRPSGQGNHGCATIEALLVMGEGYPFRLGTCGTVSGLAVVDGSWYFAPVDVNCGLVSKWSAYKVAIDSNYNITQDLGAIPCSGSGT
jgi:hypothetical protein